MDQFILLLGNNLKKKYIQDFFFIRYWKGSPHIRIRVKKGPYLGEKELHILLVETRDEFFNKYKNLINVSINPKNFYANNFTDGKNFLNIKYWYKNGEIVSIPYFPEEKRYGGKEYMDLSEHAFIVSSKLSLFLLQNTDNSLIKKLMLYFATMDLLLDNIYEKKESIKFCKFGYNFWNESGADHTVIYSDTISKINALIDKYNVQKLIKNNELYRSYLHFLQKIYVEIKSNKSEEYAKSVIFSQLHMFSNRMGTGVNIESSYYKNRSDGELK